VFVLFKEAHFYAELLPVTPRCASRGRWDGVGGIELALWVFDEAHISFWGPLW